MSGQAYKNLIPFQWRCGRCEKWNGIEKGICSTCKQPAQQFADAFRMKNVLTAEETNFYAGTAVWSLRTLNKISDKMSQVIELLEEQNNGKAEDVR